MVMKKVWIHILNCSYVGLVIQSEAEIMKSGMYVFKSSIVVWLTPKQMDFFI